MAKKVCDVTTNRGLKQVNIVDNVHTMLQKFLDQAPSAVAVNYLAQMSDVTNDDVMCGNEVIVYISIAAYECQVSSLSFW